MRRTLILLFLLLTLMPVGTQARQRKAAAPAIDSSSCSVLYLTTEQFTQEVARLDTNVWIYKGDKPCVIDLYTTWCGPCKRLAPVMEELAHDFCERVCFYRTDIERDRVLGRVFGASSIPTIVYIPVNGQPTVTKGLMPKEDYVRIIEQFLLGNPEATPADK